MPPGVGRAGITGMIAVVQPLARGGMVARCGCDPEAFRTLIDDYVRVSFRAHDGSVTGPRDAIAAIVVRSPEGSWGSS
jgi:hypothetical protein